MSNDGTRTEEPRSSPRDRPKIGRAPILVIVILAALAAASLLVMRLSSPPQTDLATVSQLLASNEVMHLDLSGSTLTVTKKGGDQLQVASVTLDEFQPLENAAALASVPVSASSGGHTALGDLAFLATLSLPLIVLIAIVLVLVRVTRRPPRITFAR